MADKDTLAEEREAFEAAHDAEAENRAMALEDLRFARMSEQWPDKIRKQREDEGRPVLTINKMPAFIRQVVNDSRMNKPQIKVKGIDDNSDPETADVLEGLIRNIEYVSKADVAYDTAVDSAASCGRGYIRIAIDYEYDDTFDKGLRIKRVANPFTIYGDPYSTEADSSDWNQAHVVEYLKKDEFQRRYKGAEAVDWVAEGYEGLQMPWREDDQIMVCEAWRRETVKRKLLLLSDGRVIGDKEYISGKDFFDIMGLTVTNQRDANAYKITQRIMTGAEILEENEWAGQYIPVIPVYGEEINIEGKRYFRSLIHNAKDAQRMFNYWRTTATELVALAPRVPFIGEKGAFDEDPNWQTANTMSHPYLMYKKGTQAPQRQPLDSGTAVGAMSEAMAVADDMKAIIGMYDASLGQRSNETSGKAIMARQREGDTSTFHFIDNLARAIRQTGCCLIDLIPKVYTGNRIVRILGEDGKEQIAKLGQQQAQQPMGPQGMVPNIQTQQPEPGDNDMAPNHEQSEIAKIYDLSVGKYDVAVSSGPGFTTRREEAANQMTEIIRSFPAAAPVIGPELVKALDLPNGDEIAQRLENMLPPQAKGGLPPELQQMIEGGKKQIEQQGQQIEQMKVEKAMTDKQHQLDLAEKDLEAQSLKMEIARLKALDTIDQHVQSAVASSMPKEAPVPAQPPQINLTIPEGLGSALGNAVVQGTQGMLSNLPPLQVNMPPAQRMRRKPIRDANGMITETIDEPILEEAGFNS